jgi:hypothetical protein
MIHFTPQGGKRKLGLNLHCAKGGFVAVWVWYDFVTHIASIYRFRLRLHTKPRILWYVERFNVIDDHIWNIDCELVPREVMDDLRAKM